MEERLARLQATYIGLDAQTDYYFETPYGKLKRRQGTIENLITHYERVVVDGVEKTRVYQYDVNPTKEQIYSLERSHRQIGVVRKDRKIYLLNHVKIHLDQLPDGSCFVEVEAIDRSNNFTDRELKEQCLAMKMLLGIADSELVKTGYWVK